MGLNRSVNAWLSTLSRMVGIAGLIYEVVVDRFRHPEALGIFGGLAGLPDVLGLTASLRRQRREQDDEEDERQRQRVLRP
jgi:hypothetical protein